MSMSMLGGWAEAQRLKAAAMSDDIPVFYRGLEKTMDKRRSQHGLVVLRSRSDAAVDLSSNDFLSLTSSGSLRKAFLEELASHPDFQLGSTGSRLLDGNNTYIETVEKELAEFHGAEDALIVNSGYEANGAIFTAIPQPGDVIVYDELIHASVHDGMRHTLASDKAFFRHNSVESFVETLQSVKETHPRIRNGESTVLVAIESVYSMDGDISPVKELIDAAKSIFPDRNTVQFIIDEAHSTGVIGPKGAGLICRLGLEKEMAIRVHTFGKALGSHGAVILANDTIRTMLINYARSVIYTTAPSFPMLAAIRAGYTLMKDGETQLAQGQVQTLVKHFFSSMESNHDFRRAQASGVLSIPVMDIWQQRPFVTHIVPVWTRPRYNHFLVFHLQLANFCAWAIDYPVVPQGTARVRLVFHANNTIEQVEELARLVCGWAAEMMDIEEGKTGDIKIPKAAQKVYAYLTGEVVAGVYKEPVNGKVEAIAPPKSMDITANGSDMANGETLVRN